LHIAEEHEQRRKNKTDAEIKDNHTEYRNYEHKERPRKRHAVYNTEDEEHRESKPEVYKRGNVLREQEKIFRNVYLGEYPRVREKRTHAAVRRVCEKREDDITAEKIDRIMRLISSEEVGENEAHYKKRE
jgi:hypothetical protein